MERNDSEISWAESKSIYIKHEKDVIAGQEYDVIEPLQGVVKTNC